MTRCVTASILHQSTLKLNANLSASSRRQEEDGHEAPFSPTDLCCVLEAISSAMRKSSRFLRIFDSKNRSRVASEQVLSGDNGKLKGECFAKKLPSVEQDGGKSISADSFSRSHLVRFLLSLST